MMSLGSVEGASRGTPSLTSLTLTSTRCRPTLPLKVCASLSFLCFVFLMSFLVLDSVDGASRVLRSSAVPAVHASPLVFPDVSSSTGAPAFHLHGAPVSSASIHGSSKSGKAPRSKVKPLPKSKSQPKSSVNANSSSATWGSLTVRVDPSGTVKLHDVPLDLLTKESLRTLLIAHNVDRHSKRKKTIGLF